MLWLEQRGKKINKDMRRNEMRMRKIFKFCVYFLFLFQWKRKRKRKKNSQKANMCVVCLNLFYF